LNSTEYRRSKYSSSSSKRPLHKNRPLNRSAFGIARQPPVGQTYRRVQARRWWCSDIVLWRNFAQFQRPRTKWPHPCQCLRDAEAGPSSLVYRTEGENTETGRCLLAVFKRRERQSRVRDGSAPTAARVPSLPFLRGSVYMVVLVSGDSARMWSPATLTGRRRLWPTLRADAVPHASAVGVTAVERGHIPAVGLVRRAYRVPAPEDLQSQIGHNIGFQAPISRR